MVFRSGAGHRQGTTGRKVRRRGRRNLTSRVKYQRPSARNQQSQLRSLARIAVQNARILRASKVYCDWNIFASPALQVTLSGWVAPVPLTHIVGWQPTNRQNLDVVNQSTTFIRDMQFEWSFNCGSLPSPINCSMYIVTIRPDASSWLPTITMSQGRDFCLMGEKQNMPVLNSGLFKVHFAKYFRCYPLVNGAGDMNGNPLASYRRGKVNLKLGYRIRSPTDMTWKQLSIRDLPASQRLYLMLYFQTGPGPTAAVAEFDYGCKYTTINQD